MVEKRIESVNAFYDAVAGDYNGHMTPADRRVREQVKHIFRKRVPKGIVLDFGGGTGLDLDWLLDAGYEVSFLEPSDGMRAIAKKIVVTSGAPHKVTVLESGLDIFEWEEGNLPVISKMDGILANFAVLNCTDHLQALFKKLSLVSTTGSALVATILDPQIRSVRKHYSLLLFIRLLLAGTLRILNKHNDIYHNTFIHTERYLKSACSPYFSIQSFESLPESPFAVVVLTRK